EARLGLAGRAGEQGGAEASPRQAGRPALPAGATRPLYSSSKPNCWATSGSSVTRRATSSSAPPSRVTPFRSISRSSWAAASRARAISPTVVASAVRNLFRQVSVYSIFSSPLWHSLLVGGVDDDKRLRPL